MSTAKNMEYPIKIRAHSSFIRELYDCEYGRYEDAQVAREANDQETIKANGYEVVACDFLLRRPTTIIIENDEELKALWYALASGTIGLYRPTCRFANKVLDKLREKAMQVDPGMVKLWPYNSGR